MKSVFLLFYICFISYFLSFSQNEDKFFIGCEVAGLYPYIKINELFSFKYSPQTEIQGGLSLTLIPSIQIGKSFSLFTKAGYIWHKKLQTETIFESSEYECSIFYRTIPIHAGISLTLLESEKYKLSAFADGGYNIIYRYIKIPQISYSNSTLHNGFGYTVGIMVTRIYSVPVSYCFGIGKKEETKYFYFFSYINLYPSIFKKQHK
jgi:hypothetical protein